MSHGSAWQIETDEDGTMTIAFNGEINEAFEPAELIAELKSAKPAVIRLNCSQIRRMNSDGIRRWVIFIRAAIAVREDGRVEYVECAVPVVNQFNMIPAMTEHTVVHSIYVPFVCEETDEECDRLVEVSTIDPASPPTFPNEEGGEWVLDEDPRRFFAFLRSGTS